MGLGEGSRDDGDSYRLHRVLLLLHSPEQLRLLPELHLLRLQLRPPVLTLPLRLLRSPLRRLSPALQLPPACTLALELGTQLF